MLKVSIIIPVYKAERHLGQCVESVLKQTFQNLEIILVDDGSPDLSPQICDEYAAVDNRIIVIHQDNCGASGARNCGVMNATGDYLMFLDSDDWLDDNTVQSCVNLIIDDSTIDCVGFSYVREYPSKSLQAHVMESSVNLKDEEVKDQIHRRLFGLVENELLHPERLENMGSCCMKLYKATIARKGFFIDIKDIGSCEDTLFNIAVLNYCKHYVYLDEPFYHYRKEGNSITSTYRPNLSRQWCHLFNLMEEYIGGHNLNQSYTYALNTRIALSIVGIGLNEISDINSSFIKKNNKIREYICSQTYQNAVRQVDVGEMPIIWRTFLLSAKYRCSLMILIELMIVNIIRRRH